MSFLSRVTDVFSAQITLLRLQREMKALRSENAALKESSESMRRGMRRCVSCEYRLDYKERQGKAPILNTKNVEAPD
jgi:hypothetical protein